MSRESGGDLGGGEPGVGGGASGALPAYLVALVDAAADPTVLLDEARRLLHGNAAYRAYAGLSWRELERQRGAGVRCHELFRLEICETSCAAHCARDRGRFARFEQVSARRGNGEVVMVSVTSVPLAGVGFLETYRDQTAELRLQQRYKELLAAERASKSGLEQAVRARTAELRAAQAQLVQSEKMSALGQLVAGVAHELNNPLHFIYASVDFVEESFAGLGAVLDEVDSALARGEAPDPARLLAARDKVDYAFLRAETGRLLRGIHEGATRAAAIVRDLKLFSRVGQRDFKAIDLTEGLRATCNLLRPVHRGQVEIALDLEALPSVRCNGGQVNQLFMNLVANAIDAVEGAGRVVVAGRRDGGDVVFEVRDDGPGVPPELRERIFEPFFTTKDVGQGTGLGLAIAFSIVEEHGGQIAVGDAPEGGACFTVRLPIVGPPERRPSRAPAST